MIPRPSTSKRGSKMVMLASWLTPTSSYCHFDRSGMIEMHFANRTLRVEGRNLRDLYAALAKHMVSAIQQAEASEGGAERDTSIDKIEVTDEEE